MKNFRSVIRFTRFQRTVAATVVLLILCLLPFASALEIHHVFAEVDHDGHEHADFDLCQWVQAHGSGTVDLDQADIGIPLQVDRERWSSSEIIFPPIALTSHGSRGPPLFL